MSERLPFWMLGGLLAGLVLGVEQRHASTSLWVADHELGLPPHVSRFVLGLGAAANQNGTALFVSVTVLFLAQLFSMELDLGRQLAVAFVCVLVCRGGVARLLKKTYLTRPMKE